VHGGSTSPDVARTPCVPHRLFAPLCGEPAIPQTCVCLIILQSLQGSAG
jgi:hypothetical protein